MAKITQCNNYSDENGNKIIGKIEGCEVLFSGTNSVLKIGDNFCAGHMQISIGSDCDIEVGNNVTVSGSSWNFYNNAACSIGDNCRFRHGGFINIAPFAKIIIGQGFTAEHELIMIALPYTEIRFGEDCMLSRRVSIQSNDGHDIFDVRTGQNINATADLSKSKKIIIGNHVWIGQDVSVLYNTEIGDGSIVGAKSLVKNKFPNNCLIGGNPAKLIKTDVAWSRGCGDTDIKVIDERYVKLTKGH